MHILKGKRIAAVLIAGAFLLTGCGQKGTPSQISEPVSEKMQRFRQQWSRKMQKK